MRHEGILKKLVERHETQQKVIELALESLNNPGKGRRLTPDEEVWLHIYHSKSSCVIQKDRLRILLETADIDRLVEYTAHQMPLQYVTEFHCQKPLTECSLKEILEAQEINLRVCKQFDTVSYSDDGDHFTLKISHDMGLINSQMLQLFLESLFNSCGVRNEYQISERSIFVKVYKPQ